MRQETAALRVRTPFSRVVTASHDEYFSSFRRLRLGGFILGRAGQPWRLTRCRLASSVLEHGVDAAPWTASVSPAGGFVSFAFPGRPHARMSVDGWDISNDAACIRPGTARVSVVARRPADWFVVSAAERDLEAFVPPMAGVPQFGLAAGPLHAGPEALARVRALATQVLEAFESAGRAGLAPEIAASLEQSLLGEVVTLAARPRSSHGNGTARIDRRHVLETVEDLFEARPSEPVYVADLCSATGLPERTLRYILVEQFGTSPIRLLRCRRLCQLRRSLEADLDGIESLARIAARHGFWHMGTLAADYRELFGELPSETRRSGGGLVNSPARGTLAFVSPPEVPGRAPEPVSDSGA